MRRSLPVILCSTIGVLMLLQYFIPHQLSQAFFERTLKEVKTGNIVLFSLSAFPCFQLPPSLIMGWDFLQEKLKLTALFLTGYMLMFKFH